MGSTKFSRCDEKLLASLSDTSFISQLIFQTISPRIGESKQFFGSDLNLFVHPSDMKKSFNNHFFINFNFHQLSLVKKTRAEGNRKKNSFVATALVILNSSVAVQQQPVLHHIKGPRFD